MRRSRYDLSSPVAHKYADQEVGLPQFGKGGSASLRRGAGRQSLQKHEMISTGV